MAKFVYDVFALGFELMFLALVSASVTLAIFLLLFFF